jgi:hypothetical protein
MSKVEVFCEIFFNEEKFLAKKFADPAEVTENDFFPFWLFCSFD